MIDPLADKLLISAALISLVQMDLAPAWMVAVIIGREFAVTGLRSLAYARGVAIPASPLGKIKMVAQVVAILALDSRAAGGCRRVLPWIGYRTVGRGDRRDGVRRDYFRRFNLFLNPRVADFRVARDAQGDRKAG